MFLAGNYFARKREILCQKDPYFMSNKQYWLGCNYLTKLLVELDISTIQNRQSDEILTKIVIESEYKPKISF